MKFVSFVYEKNPNISASTHNVPVIFLWEKGALANALTRTPRDHKTDFFSSSDKRMFSILLKKKFWGKGSLAQLFILNFERMMLLNHPRATQAQQRARKCVCRVSSAEVYHIFGWMHFPSTCCRVCVSVLTIISTRKLYQHFQFKNKLFLAS